MMKVGGYFYRHDFGRNKRGRKHLKLSPDGLSLKWKAVGANEIVAESPGGSSARGGVFRSSSFSRTTSSERASRAFNPREQPSAPHRSPPPRRVARVASSRWHPQAMPAAP